MSNTQISRWNGWIRRNTSGRSEYLGPSSPSFDIIKEFIDNSKKNQTLYANFEGSYERRVFNKMNELEEFIYVTLFSNDKTFAMEENPSKTLKVKRMRGEITSLADKFDTNGEIHLTVIWVYCFVYDAKESKAVPVFKLYKSKSSNSAIFLDPDYNKYSGWEYYLDHAGLPPSFLCVPRNGSYVFHPDSKKLDLIYINSQRRAAVSFDLPVHTPYCVRTIPTMLSSSKHLLEDVIDFILDCCRKVKPYSSIIFYTAVVGVEMLSGAPFNILHPRVVNMSRMILNSRALISERTDLVQSPGKLSSFGQENKILQLIQAPKIAWDKLFCEFVNVFSDNLDILLPALERFPLMKTVLVVLRFFLCGIKAVVEKYAGDELMIKSDCTNLGRLNGSTAAGGESPVAKREENAYSFISNNHQLEEVSFEKLKEKAESERKRKIVADSEEIVLTPFSIPVNPEFPGKLYVFPEKGFKEIEKRLKLLFENYKVEMREEKVYDVVDAEGQRQATLYFLNETSAFLWVLQREGNEVVSN